MTRTYIPQPILDAAHARAAARASRDWAAADRIREEIEAAGWRVVDAGTDFRLELAHPPDLEVDGALLYGRSSAVPSRLDEPSTGLATFVIPAGRDGSDLERAVSSVRTHAPEGVGIVVVADDPAPAMGVVLDAMPAGVEVLRTSEALGTGASWNIGLKRATSEIVILLDPSVELVGDVVRPLAEALQDAATAVAGPFGLRSGDLRRFDEWIAAGRVAAIEGYLIAFRRSDVATHGPIDEGFRFYRNLDIWWSLALRDDESEAPPRDAVVVPDLPVRRHEHRGWTALEPAERERLSKRNFYRLLSRFRGRDDLIVDGAESGPG
ncbi:MAG: glycosyltransferase [Candidatus Limnocylindrales bacterium]